MTLKSEMDIKLIEAIQDGIPLVSRPYREIGDRIGMSEQEVVEKIRQFQDYGIIKRFGIVVRHHELGYRANAMVVWDVPDERVQELGKCMGQFEFVTLCYQRTRSLPHWPYNLYCMIHGQDRAVVLKHLSELINHCGIQGIPCEVLFSRRRFKQRGAVYCRDQGNQSALSAVPDGSRKIRIVGNQ
ncbi:MAG: AsnC family transcriptional regulator [Gammaproteobacteria bacterium]|nr:AsnC family transcriptional regulator [Gammaproteobacteria bacterium]